MNGINMKKDKLLIVLAAAWITYTTAYLCRVNISTALDKLGVGLEVSLEYLGAASSVYFVTYAIGQLLNGIAGVHAFHDEDVRFGGAGITVVEF